MAYSQDENEATTEHYEMFCPLVYIKDKEFGNFRNPYRMLIFASDGFTFVMLLKGDNYKYSARVYQQMRDTIISKAINMHKKLDPIVEYNDENPLEEEEAARFLYFNQSNLAIKQSPKYNNKLLTNELRHFSNVIKLKFDNNPILVEYQITSSSYWLIGRNTSSRITIVVLPLSLSQAEAETEAKRMQLYFPYF